MSRSLNPTPSYRYIEVASPTGGLVLDKAATDIQNTESPDCSNVYFEDGVIKKRFGYTAAKQRSNADGDFGGGHPDYVTYTTEITCMVVHEHNLNALTSYKRVFAFSLTDAFYWRPSDPDWFMLSQAVANDTESSSWDEWDEGKSATNVYSPGGNLDDLSIEVKNRQNRTGVVDNFRIQIATSGTPDTYMWATFSAPDYIWWTGSVYTITSGDALSTSFTTTNPFLITDGTLDYSYVSVQATTGHTKGDNWTSSSNHTVESSTDEVKIGSDSLKIVTSSAFTSPPYWLAVRHYVEHSWERVNAIDLWIHPVTNPLNDGDLVIYIFDDTSSVFEGNDIAAMVDASDVITRGAVTTIDIPASAADTWTRHQISFTALGSDYSVSSRSVAIGTTLSIPDRTFYFDSLRFLDVVATGVGENATKSTPTLAATATVTLDSSLQTYLMVTNWADTHYLRYIDNSEEPPTYRIATGANDTTSGYNDSSGVDFHKCRASSGFEQHLHLLGSTEKQTSLPKTDHLQQDRWSALRDGTEWIGGTSSTQIFAETSGAILNAAVLQGDHYIFKTDSIVRQRHVGGSNIVFSQSTIYTDDALISARLMLKYGDAIYWVGKRNVYRYRGGSMERIGDQIKQTLFSSAFLEYSNGANYKRSHMFLLQVEGSSRSFLVLVIPTATAFPDKALVFDLDYEVWTLWDFTAGVSKNITAAVSYFGLRVAGTETNFQFECQFGNSGGEFHQFDAVTPTVNDGVANGTGTNGITGYWRSKDFANPEYGRTEFTRWRGIKFEAQYPSATNVTGSVRVRYSIDGGVSWETAGTKTLTTGWKRYFLSFTQDSQLLRIEFYDDAADKTFEVRWFSLQYEAGPPY